MSPLAPGLRRNRQGMTQYIISLCFMVYWRKSKGGTGMQKPKCLRRGDQVAIVSLSRGMLGETEFIHKYYLAKERLEKEYGLNVVPMPNALKGIDYLYRHPEARAQDPDGRLPRP